MSDAVLPPTTRLGRVSLTVTHLGRSLDFYQRVIGLQVLNQAETTAELGVNQTPLLVLTGQSSARRVSGVTGLYHFAILTPSRAALASALKRIADTQAPVQGFADHGVSEAVYLADPDGNGIEIYRDRPQQEWPVHDGQLQMVTDPLDLQGLLAELPDPPQAVLPSGTVIGHVHLHVANIPQAEQFYRQVLGFDLMQRFGGTAAFLSVGGYHHHLGVNTWAGEGAPPPPPDAVGLRWFELRLPSADALSRLVNRLAQAGAPVTERDGGIFTCDPSQNGILLTA